MPTTRPILLCKNSNLKCGMKWPMWRGECYLPPCCNTVAGWAQSPLWYPSFKSRPFSLFVCLFYFRSPSCNTLWVTNSLSPVCCLLEFIAYVLWFGPNSANLYFIWKKEKHPNFWGFLPQNLVIEATYWDWTTVHIDNCLSSVKVFLIVEWEG